MLETVCDILVDAYKRNWITSRDGNVSIRRHDRDHFYITPSSVRKQTLQPDQFKKIAIFKTPASSEGDIDYSCQEVEVNFVFNFVNDLSHKHIKREKKFLSAFDINEFTKGCTDKSLGEFKLNLHSQTIQAINEEYVLRRQQFKKAKLNWRVSSKYSLGWIPFKSSGIQMAHGQIKYAGACLSIWDSYHINQYKDSIKSGSFVEDARGRWYVCMVVDLDKFQKNKELNGNNLKDHKKEINLNQKNSKKLNKNDSDNLNISRIVNQL